MFYNDKIVFSDKLNEAENEAIGNIFQDFKVYAIHTGFQLNYNPEFKRVLSDRYANNSLDELKWLKAFAKKQLKTREVFMILNLWLGKETNFNRIKTEYVEIDDWELSDDKRFEFSYGKIYQFADNSDEAILRRKNKNFK